MNMLEVLMESGEPAEETTLGNNGELFLPESLLRSLRWKQGTVLKLTTYGYALMIEPVPRDRCSHCHKPNPDGIGRCPVCEDFLQMALNDNFESEQ